MLWCLDRLDWLLNVHGSRRFRITRSGSLPVFLDKMDSAGTPYCQYLQIKHGATAVACISYECPNTFVKAEHLQLARVPTRIATLRYQDRYSRHSRHSRSVASSAGRRIRCWSVRRCLHLRL